MIFNNQADQIFSGSGYRSHQSSNFHQYPCKTPFGMVLKKSVLKKCEGYFFKIAKVIPIAIELAPSCGVDCQVKGYILPTIIGVNKIKVYEK